MTVTITSRAFNHDTAGAKRAALRGPVFITDRGKPAHVLMTVEEYRRLNTKGRSLADVLGGAPEVAEFEPPRLGDHIFRPVDFDDD